MGKFAYLRNNNEHEMNFFNELKADIVGEVHFDSVHRAVYSVDASIYEIEPIGIVIPHTKKDLLKVIQVSATHNIALIPRGAATGITGGCLGQGLIVDTSKYLNKIIEINYEQEYAICEPGVVQDQLNAMLAERGYRLGPDTSTGNRATLGGMVANNAAGSRSLRYGTMADHLLEIELALASGELLRLGHVNALEFAAKASQNDEEGHIYRTIQHIQNTYHDEIVSRFPHIPRRVSGYNLDALTEKYSLNLCRLIAASEGSLGIVTQIKVRITRKPHTVGLCVMHFDDMLEGMSHVEEMLKHKPMAIELIDDKIIEAGRQSPSMRGKLDWFTNNPKVIFVVEFDGPSVVEVQQNAIRFAADMQKKNIGKGHIVIMDPTEMEYVWDLRKAGLGLLLSKRSYSRAIAFLEDITVAPKNLAAFMQKFRIYLKNIGKEAGIYGHVGSGCMHVRPYINLCKEDDVQIMERMMYEVSDMLLAHGGALSGEHGDGLARSWLNKKMFGDKLYNAFLELKEVFDPHNRMNPGKVVNGPPFLENLRQNPEIPIRTINTFLDFSKEGGFELAADLCNGNGLCRKSEKVMCPSFQASGDEFHTTRARAQALRTIIHQRLPLKDFTSQDIHDVMDLCIECKGCKTECPSEVDMAKMKAEFLYHYHKVHGTPLRDHLFANIGRINQLASWFPNLFNKTGNSKISKKLLEWIGITPKRELPAIAQERFSRWFNKRTYQQNDKKVVLYNDTFTEFNDPEIGKAAVKVLEALGYSVIVPPWQCCGRPAFSKGNLRKAKTQAMKVIHELLPYAKEDIPIIGLEPSCILTIKDDFYGLLRYEDTDIAKVVGQCHTFDEFVAQHLQFGELPLELHEKPRYIKVHGHCHQKSLVGMLPTLRVLNAIPQAKVEEIKSGCCGMAGSFGYESEHYEFSLKIGELKLFPAVSDSAEETIIVANGVSCRSQIMHGTGRTSYHLAELLEHCFEWTNGPY